MDARQTIHRNNRRIAYSVQGEGPLVLLIQGLAMSSRSWLQTSIPLMQGGFRVAAIDNRGTGLSERSLPPYSMREMALDAAFLIEHLGGPAIVAGLSLGGMIAQHLAIDHPTHVSGLVLAGTTLGNPFGKLPRPRVLAALTLGILGHRKSMKAMRGYLVHPANLARNPSLLDEFERTVSSEGTSWKTLVGQLGAACLHNTYWRVREIRVPVEVVAGDHDVVLPTPNARLLAQRIPGANLTILPQAGHAFPLEYPMAIPDAVDRVHRRLGVSR